MEFQNVPGEKSTGRNKPLEQLEKALDKGTSKNVAKYGTLLSHDDAIREIIENASHMKIHDVSEFPDQMSFTSHLSEFSTSMDAFTDKGNGKVFEQLNSPFQILPEEFQANSKNRGLRPRSFSDREVSSFPWRRNGRDVNNFDCEEINTKTVDIQLNERSSPFPPRPFHQDQRRPAFVKTTKNRSVMEGKGERSYRKEKLHKTTSSSSTSSRRNHMPVTRSKSLGGKPNYPLRGNYSSMDYHGKGRGNPSLRRQALTNAASLSLAIKNPASYQEPTNDLNQEYRQGMRQPREDNRTKHQKLGKHGTHSRKAFHRLEFIGLLPLLDIPGIDTGEVIFCPPNGCEHIRIADCPWGSQKDETKIEFFHPTPVAVDLDEGLFKTNKSRTYSLPDYPKDEADDTFFRKFRDLESYWNRRRSSPLLLPSPWSPTSSRPSIWQPSNDANLSPFSLYLSNSAPCTPSYMPVSLKVPSLSDLANTESTSPTIDGSVFFPNIEMFRKPEDIPQHHPVLKRNMSDPPSCSTWHPLRSSLKSPLSQDLESGKHFNYNGK